MTEHVVLRRASDARADLQHRRELALIALDAIDEEISEVERFIDMYHRFSGVGVEPLPADANPEQEIGGAEGDVRPGTSSSDTSGIPTPALDHPTGKPAGETDGSPAAPSRLERIKAVLTEHPDWTARQIGDELGLHQKHVNAVAEKHELIIRRLTPEEKQQKRIEGARLGGQISRSPAPGPVPEIPVKLKDRIVACHKAHPDWDTHQIADAIGEKANSVSAYKSMLGLPIPVRPRAPSKGPRKFVARKGEGKETTVKRGEVAALNWREPWLAPHEAASRLQIPLVNLRIFSAELGIAWAQPRSQSEPKSPILAEKAPTISQRVAALRRMHPTWTPALIAAELGIRASDVRAVDARGLQIIGVTQVAK